MHLLDPIDLYCERTSAALWAEPLNAISNVGFFVAAWLLWRAASKHERLYAVLLALVGVGSFVFHTTARVITQAPDGLFILVFIVVYFKQTLESLGVTKRQALGAATVVLVAHLLAAPLARVPIANGSLVYLPTLGAMAYLGWRAHRQDHALGKKLLRVLSLFLLALSFRTLDGAVCNLWPLGTHFAWHLLTALTAYVAAKR